MGGVQGMWHSICGVAQAVVDSAQVLVPTASQQTGRLRVSQKSRAPPLRDVVTSHLCQCGDGADGVNVRRNARVDERGREGRSESVTLSQLARRWRKQRSVYVRAEMGV